MDANGRRLRPAASTASPSTSPAAHCWPTVAEVPLRPKSFALLRLLVENAGRLLDRDAIMAAVWPDVMVTDDRSPSASAISARPWATRRSGCSDRAGARLPLRAEVTLAEPATDPARRAWLAAILAADVAGYSRLMQRDEAGTLGRLTVHRKSSSSRSSPTPWPCRQTHGRRRALRVASVVDAVACAVRYRAAWPSGRPICPRWSASASDRHQPRRHHLRGRRRHLRRRRQHRRAAGGIIPAGRNRRVGRST